MTETAEGSKYERKKSRRRGRSGNGKGAGRRARPRTGEDHAPVDTARKTPGAYLATLEDRGFIQLHRDRARLRADFHRLVEARKEDPARTIGQGWGLVELGRVLDQVAEQMPAKEADFLEILFADLPDDDDMAPPPMGHDDPLFIEPEGGIHPHHLEPGGATSVGGRHSHAFLMDGELHFTEWDGVHRHDADEGNPDVTAPEADHEHVAFLMDGTRLAFTDAGEHTHEKLTGTTTMDGLHQHTATLEREGEDAVEIRTLSPSEFRELFMPTMEARAAEAVAGLVSDMPHIRILEAAGAGEWSVTIIEAGLSKNGNFWPASVLAERGAAVFENAPLEVLQFSATHFSHAPHDPHRDLPAGVVANTAGILTGVTFEDTGGTAPSQPKAEAIAQMMGWSVEKVMDESVGRLVSLAKLDGSTTAEDIQARLAFAEEEGLLGEYLGLSIDVAEADPTLVNARDEDGSIVTMAVRTDISAESGVLVDFVSRPSAGGSVDAQVAA